MNNINLDEWTARAPKPFPPHWASTWGVDPCGLWADAEVSIGAKSVAQRMRWIEHGCFDMGASNNEYKSPDYEHPQHRVTITQGFWLADTACTQALWEMVIGKTPPENRYMAPSKREPEHPVGKLNWKKIQEFLKVVEKLLPGSQATLPTEAEWEYACRAGTTTPFSFGSNITTDQANFIGKFPWGRGKNKGEIGESRRHTVAVKDLPANAWGLYQMHGNVDEWCADRLRQYSAEAIVDPGLAEALTPQAGDKDAPRVLRGGSWRGTAYTARSAHRFHDLPEGDGGAGFRFALRSKR